MPIRSSRGESLARPVKRDTVHREHLLLLAPLPDRLSVAPELECVGGVVEVGDPNPALHRPCLLYTSDAADEEDSVDLGGRRIMKKKKKRKKVYRERYKCYV
eukprot:TRINITY_DN48843_c0_g1_i1.p2 TRINITY_DN48843_c0_g1~~TRINITY_DN48843_c0_g1_i1.p2  ORF type:complete len:102 (-),score=8.12 TRINITY_DN48843_c0_g1_i1:44-349(-)